MPSDGAPSFYAATIGVWSRLREAGPAARRAPISTANISALECAPGAGQVEVSDLTG